MKFNKCESMEVFGKENTFYQQKSIDFYWKICRRWDMKHPKRILSTVMIVKMFSLLIKTAFKSVLNMSWLITKKIFFLFLAKMQVRAILKMSWVIPKQLFKILLFFSSSQNEGHKILVSYWYQKTILKIMLLFSSSASQN